MILKTTYTNIKLVIYDRIKTYIYYYLCNIYLKMNDYLYDIIENKSQCT